MNKKIISLTIAAIMATSLVGCKDKTEVVPYNADKQAKVEKKIDKLSEVKDEDKLKDNLSKYPGYNSIIDLSKVDALTTELIEKQVSLRTAKKFAEAHKINYTMDDVEEYFKIQSNLTANKLRSKVDVAVVMNSDIELIGIKQYAIDHQIEYLKFKALESELQPTIKELSEEEKNSIIDEYSGIYESLSMSEQDSKKASIEAAVTSYLQEGYESEISDISYLERKAIFIEVRPEIYNKLPDNAQGDEYKTK